MLDRDAGAFRIGPSGVAVPASRRHLPGTMVLEMSWNTGSGWVIVRDVLLIGAWHHESERSHTHRRTPTDCDADHVPLRTVRCVNGEVEVPNCPPVTGWSSTCSSPDTRSSVPNSLPPDRSLHEVFLEKRPSRLTRGDDGPSGGG